MIKGFDISDNNDIDWQTISPDFQFCIVKKSEGASYTDKDYAYRANYLKGTNLLHGFYHYFSPADSVQSQLNNYLNGLDLTGCMPPILDAEVDGITIEMVTEFLAGLQQATERKPILYSYPSFLTDNLHDYTFDAYLWIAAYQPEPPKFDWTVWQNSQYGTQQGELTGGDLDIDVTNLTLDELKAL